MFIDQAKIMEKYTQTVGNEQGKVHMPNDCEPQSVFDFGKLKESYRMTEGGSFFMPNAVYQKPEKKDETVIEQLDTQMDMSAANRKNQMIVVSNTASPEDLQEMSKDGFSGLDMDSHTIVTVTDKIKAVLAKAGVDISIYGDSLSMDQLEEITGSTAMANQIAGALKEADLPITDANVEECETAFEASTQLQPLSDASKEYLLKNEWAPTIKNLYLAEHSGVPTKDKPVDFAALEKQISQIITDAGFEVTTEQKENCKWLIGKNIELTTKNLKYLNGLQDLSLKLDASNKESLDANQVISRMVEAIKDGKRPMDAVLVDGFSLMDRAEKAMETVTVATDEDVAYCVQNQMNVSIENLEIAISNRQQAKGVVVDAEMSTNISFVTAKRQLEETRLAMTTAANYALLKRGISIDTKPLEQVVENLKDLEKQYYKDLMQQSGVETTEKNVSVFAQTSKVVEELKFQPAYVLSLHSSEETLSNIHHAGANLKASLDAAMQSYEALWTAPRKDMGDSIQKAFGNVGAILEDLNLEKTDLNQRAVRILAYNEIEITVENITQIKNVDMEMQKLFQNLTPAATLELIRNGKNPLDMEIKELNHVVEDIQSGLGEKENERFSKFLWKLEQNNEISAEERDSYIGIYRLFAQVEKTDGAAIGALVNQGADITMRNLISAMRSARKTVDYSVDDHFEGVQANTRGARIDQQIMASFQTNCMKEAANLLSPDKLEKVKDWEEMTPEQLMEALKENHSDESVALEQKYFTELAQEYQSVIEASDDVYAFLEKYDLKNSANNVLAASRLLDNPSNVFDVLFGSEGKSLDYKELIAQMKDQVMEAFGEAVKTPEEMAQAQATLAEVAEKVMQTMIIENEPVSVKDLKDLRLMNQQLFLCNQKVQEESFLVPVETGDSVTGINLKIVRGKENKGLVDIFFRGALMEKVAASFEAKENGVSGIIATTDEQTRQLLAENIGLFVDKMNQGSSEAIDVKIAYVDDLSAWQFEKNTLSERGEATPVQTKRLYHIAESFIQTVSELM